MMKFTRTIMFSALSLGLAAFHAPAFAQGASSVQAPAGYAPMSAPCVKQPDGKCIAVSADNPLPVTGGSGGGSSAPTRAPSTSVGGSITVANSYQSALSQNSNRLGCMMLNTSASTIRVFIGAPGSATDSAALPIAAGGSFDCSNAAGVIVTDQISVTSAAAGASFVMVSQ